MLLQYNCRSSILTTQQDCLLYNSMVTSLQSKGSCSMVHYHRNCFAHHTCCSPATADVSAVQRRRARYAAGSPVWGHTSASAAASQTPPWAYSQLFSALLCLLLLLSPALGWTRCVNNVSQCWLLKHVLANVIGHNAEISKAWQQSDYMSLCCMWVPMLE